MDCAAGSVSDTPLRKRNETSPLVIDHQVQDEKLNEDDCLCDVIFSFDTTGSMNSIIDSVRKNLVNTVDRLFNEIKGIRIGVIVHGDYCDYPKMCYKIEPSRQVETLKQFIKQAPNTSGGDSPECYEFVLNLAQKMTWKSKVKVLVLIGDESPHEVGYDFPKKLPDLGEKLKISWKEETKKCKENGIAIFSCHGLSEMNSRSKPFYEYIANQTGGFYLPLDELSSFPEYMVGICMKAMDGAEDYQSLLQNQHVIKEKINNAKDEKERNELLETEKMLNTTIEEINNSNVFSPVARSAMKSIRKTDYGKAALKKVSGSRIKNYRDEVLNTSGSTNKNREKLFGTLVDSDDEY